MAQRSLTGFSLCFTLLLSASYKTVPHGVDTNKHLVQKDNKNQHELNIEDTNPLLRTATPEYTHELNENPVVSQEEILLRTEVTTTLKTLLSAIQIVVQQLGSGGRKLSCMKENKLFAKALSSRMAILKQIQNILANPEAFPEIGIDEAMKSIIFVTHQIVHLSEAHGVQALTEEINACEQASEKFFQSLLTRGAHALDTDKPEKTTQELLQHFNKHVDKLVSVFERLGRSYFNETMRSINHNINAWKLPLIGGVALGGAIFLKASECLTAYDREVRLNAYPMQNNQGGLSIPARIGAYLSTMMMLNKGLGAFSGKIEAETGFSSSLENFYQYCSNGIRTTARKVIDKLCGTYDENKTYGLYQDPMDRWKVHTTKTFDDVVGLEYVKKPMEKVISFINNPDAFSSRGLRPGNFLFTGKPRTGKSFIAECLAGEAAKRAEDEGEVSKFGYYSLPASDIMAFGIKEFLKLAATKAPCVLVIDEFDMLGLQRTSNTPLLADFLCGMSGCDQISSDKPMIIIAITNNPENLDGALRQKGRFDQEIRFVKPTINDRFEFISKRTHALGINLENRERFQLAQETDGCVIEELEAMISHACVKSLLTKTYADFPALLDAFDYEVRRIMPTMPLTMTDTEKSIIAINHVGTALLHTLDQDSPYTLSKVSIIPRVTKVVEEHAFEQMGRPDAFKQSGIAYGNAYCYPKRAAAGILTTKDLTYKCKEALAGFAAERVLSGSCGYGFNGYNKAIAIHYARQIAGEGIPESMRSDKQKEQLYDAAVGLVHQYEEELVQLFAQHKDRLQILADLLVVLEEIHASFFQQVLQMNEEEAASLQERISYAQKMSDPSDIGKNLARGIIFVSQDNFESIKERIDAQEQKYTDMIKSIAPVA